jgi:prophage antirepressor-like protein
MNEETNFMCISKTKWFDLALSAASTHTNPVEKGVLEIVLKNIRQTDWEILKRDETINSLNRELFRLQNIEKQYETLISKCIKFQAKVEKSKLRRQVYFNSRKNQL